MGQKIVRLIRNLQIQSDVQTLFQMIIGIENIALNIAEYCNGTGGPNHLQVIKLVGCEHIGAMLESEASDGTTQALPDHWFPAGQSHT